MTDPGENVPLICDVAWCGQPATGGEIGEAGDLLLCAYHLKHPGRSQDDG